MPVLISFEFDNRRKSLKCTKWDFNFFKPSILAPNKAQRV